MIIWSVILICAIGALVYTYLLFPWLLKTLARKKPAHSVVFSKPELCPKVSILMSVYNEEKIIAQKLDTLLEQNYPKDRYQILIGSDCSDDATNHIILEKLKEYPHISAHFYPYAHRQGKPVVINQLYEKACQKWGKNEAHLIMITDASVMLSADVLYHLAKHFKDNKIGLVDSHIQHSAISPEGIAATEDYYISHEIQIKDAESRLNRTMMGPLGGCYVLRSDLYRTVPHNFRVDDFFLAMHVLASGYDAINELQALCQEPVSQKITEEYRRKRRISSGNFQNLSTYWRLLFPPHWGIAFHFWGHKVLRWIGPFLIAISWHANLVLVAFWGNLYHILLLLFQTTLIVGIPLLDVILQKRGISIPLLRSIRYFFVMNLALFEGFIQYLKGIQSNVWQPTQRPDTTEQHS